MRLKVEDEIWNAFPGLHLGVVMARNIDNAGDAAEVRRATGAIQKRIRREFERETLSQDPRIQTWRRAYSQFGAKPKKYPSSVENLYRMTLKNLDLRSINPVVDITNYVSLKHIIPAGGDDLDRVQGDIRLMFASGGEPFIPLNGEVVERAAVGEVIYRDEKDVLCRRWNWRECEKTKVEARTRAVCLVLEALPPIGRSEVSTALRELGDLVMSHCGGNVRSGMLDPLNREISLQP
jgi:lysyl-tRNA synthetase class 2